MAQKATRTPSKSWPMGRLGIQGDALIIRKCPGGNVDLEMDFFDDFLVCIFVILLGFDGDLNRDEQ